VEFRFGGGGGDFGCCRLERLGLAIRSPLDAATIRVDSLSTQGRPTGFKGGRVCREKFAAERRERTCCNASIIWFPDQVAARDRL